MKALSLDLRERIVAAVDAGTSQAEAARRFEVSRKTVGRLMARRQAQGDLTPTRHPGAARRIKVENEDALRQQMQSHPHLSLREHCCVWQETQGQTISEPTLWRALKRLNWSHKKRVSAPVNATKLSGKAGASRPAG